MLNDLDVSRLSFYGFVEDLSVFSKVLEVYKIIKIKRFVILFKYYYFFFGVCWEMGRGEYSFLSIYFSVSLDFSKS